MTVKYTLSGGATKYAAYYPIEDNEIPLDLLLLKEINTNAFGNFIVGTFVLSITGNFEKIYSAGTSLASIYAEAGITNITGYAGYEDGILKETGEFSPGILSLDTFLYVQNDPSLVKLGVLHAGDDSFVGSVDAVTDSSETAIDYFDGFAGNDTFQANAGFKTSWDHFIGGDGTDTAVFRGPKINYEGGATSTGYDYRTGANDLSGIYIVDLTGLDSNVVLSGVERLQFTDLNLALDTDVANSAGGIYRLYKAALDRTPDLGGLGYWIAQADAGTKDAVRMATDFTYAEEFKMLYGVKTADNYMTGEDITALVTKIYENVLDRAPDAGGRDYYVSQITTKSKTVGQVLAEISDSGENRLAVADLIGTGIEYTPWVN
jgi:hypothetical protein